MPSLPLHKASTSEIMGLSQNLVRQQAKLAREIDEDAAKRRSDTLYRSNFAALNKALTNIAEAQRLSAQLDDIQVELMQRFSLIAEEIESVVE